MKKKALSLALALIMCLGLTIPAFAQDQSILLETGSTTFELHDIKFTLSGPVVGHTTVQVDGTVYEVNLLPKETTFSYVVPDYAKPFGPDPDMGTDVEMDIGVWDWWIINEDGKEEIDGAGFPLSGASGGISSYLMELVWNDGENRTRICFRASADVTTTQPEPPAAKSETATPTNDKLTVNGEVQNPTVYKINGNNYFKIRDLAAVLNGTEKQFDVGYDGALKSVTATTGKDYAKLDTDLAGAATGGSQTADPSNDTIYIDGQKVDAAVYKINGNNYFKLRDLGKALDFYVGYDKDTGVFIDTGKPYSE